MLIVMGRKQYSVCCGLFFSIAPLQLRYAEYARTAPVSRCAGFRDVGLKPQGYYHHIMESVITVLSRAFSLSFLSLSSFLSFEKALAVLSARY
jgi:hypothetical protein